METQLRIRHAQAVREGNLAEAERIRKELESIGIFGEWLSKDVLVWRSATKKKQRKAAAPQSGGCSVCGAPIEKTGKPGRPPTKCLDHR